MEVKEKMKTKAKMRRDNTDLANYIVFVCDSVEGVLS